MEINTSLLSLSKSYNNKREEIDDPNTSKILKDLSRDDDSSLLSEDEDGDKKPKAQKRRGTDPSSSVMEERVPK